MQEIYRGRGEEGKKRARTARPGDLPAVRRRPLPFWCAWEWVLLVVVCLVAVALGAAVARGTAHAGAGGSGGGRDAVSARTTSHELRVTWLKQAGV